MIMFSELLAIEFFNHRAIRLHHKIIFLFYFVNKCFKGNPFGMLEQDTVNVDIFAQLNFRASSPMRHICAVKFSRIYCLFLFVLL